MYLGLVHLELRSLILVASGVAAVLMGRNDLFKSVLWHARGSDSPAVNQLWHA